MNVHQSLDTDLDELLGKCLTVFEELSGIGIRICYKTLPKGTLGQTRVKKDVAYKSKGKKTILWRPVIEVSSDIKKLSDATERHRLTTYVIVHELVHISREHLSRPKGRVEHEPDFNSEVQERIHRLEDSW
ncbi:MAG: hypothetical protein QW767_06490 [Thermoprotei archaeon]